MKRSQAVQKVAHFKTHRKEVVFLRCDEESVEFFETLRSLTDLNKSEFFVHLMQRIKDCSKTERRKILGV